MLVFLWMRLVLLGCLLAVMAACGGDERQNPGDGHDLVPDSELVERGAYLVDHVALCADCHTPHKADSSIDRDRYMAGAVCFMDTDRADDEVGCLHTPNLTNHPTGLMGHTDEAIKEMFLQGRHHDEVLIPVMPYYIFHNMTDRDADAIVAYLRTVPGIEHELPAHQEPWEAPPEPAVPVDPATIPEPPADDPRHESAMRGRYLAAMAGMCMECHTPPIGTDDLLPRPIDMTRPFAGGRQLMLPMPPFDMPYVLAPNITPHATGIAGWNEQDVFDAVKHGVEKTGDPICPPMPSGPVGLYAGLTDQDAMDIANYIRTLPPIENQTEGECTPPNM